MVTDKGLSVGLLQPGSVLGYVGAIGSLSFGRTHWVHERKALQTGNGERSRTGAEMQASLHGGLARLARNAESETVRIGATFRYA